MKWLWHGWGRKAVALVAILHLIVTDRAHRDYVYRQLKTPSITLQCMALAGLAAAYALARHLLHDVFWVYLLCIAGIMAGIGISFAANTLWQLNLGGLGTTLFSSLGFRLILVAFDSGIYWTLPLCALITVSISAISSDPVTYLLLIMAVWYILGQGEQMAADDWHLLYASAAVIIGLLLSICFSRLRYLSSIAKQRLRDLAYKDYLTGIPNRRCIIDALHALPSGRPAPAGYLLMLDVDDFKKINDECGHDTGDVVLRAIAAMIASAAAGSEHGRIGGEEFAVFVADDLPCALALAGQLLQDVRRARPAGRHVSISIGVAPLRGGQVSASFRSADVALYRAKLAGKDRLALAPELTPPPQGG